MNTTVIHKIERKDSSGPQWIEVPVGTWAPGLNGMIEWLETLNPGDRAVTEVAIGNARYRLRTVVICECCRREMP